MACHKPLMRRRRMLALLLAASANASSIAPTNSSTDGYTLVNLTIANAAVTLPSSSLLPLGSTSSTLTTSGIEGPAFVANVTNQLSITSTDVTFISCDPSDYVGNIGVLDVYSSAADVGTAAIIFYSNTANWCTPSSNSTIDYSNTFSMTSLSATETLVLAIGDRPKYYDAYVGADSNDNTTSTSTSDSTYNVFQGSALAMVILYAVTGIVVALFVTILVTGSVRAHRHPERYGPRAADGRPKQTRVGGLARAMLDTIPIVKFGGRQPYKAVEIELGTSTVVEDSAQSETAKTPVAGVSEEGGLGAAASNKEPAVDDLQGCSICTEDFEVGQDQRVLPCDHKFHPACIDPWLLNVSGTCPLCRVNLQVEETQDSVDVGAEDTPPVLASGQRTSVLRNIIGIQRPERMTREQRIQALRRYRQDRAQRQAVAGVAPVAASSDEGRIQRQLGRFFNVRTRRVAAPT